MCVTDCNPSTNSTCNYIFGNYTTLYIADVEMFTLKLDHSLNAPEFNLYESAISMHSDGLKDINGKKLSPCQRELTTHGHSHSHSHAH